MRILVFLLIVANAAAVHAQIQLSSDIPVVSLYAQGWADPAFPDQRLRIARTTDSDSVIVHVPVYIRNCWRTIKSVTTFPITSFTVPIQFDSSAVEFVALDTTGHASNFSYSWALTSDTSYMNTVNGPLQIRQRGVRLSIHGQVVDPNDSLRLTGPGNLILCDSFPFVRMFTIILRIKKPMPTDTTMAATAIAIRSGLIRFNGLSTSDTLLRSSNQMSDGVVGVDNHFIDGAVFEQVRDPNRPTRRGMLWLEFTEAMPSITFTNFNGSVTLDTVTIRIPRTHTWADTANNNGVADVWVSNSIVGSRATSITVSTEEPWMRFRSVTTGDAGSYEPFALPVRSGVIPYLDNGILGNNDVYTLMWERTRAQPPFRLRIFGNNTMSAKNGRFVGAISFTSTTMRPERVDLPVVLIISDTTTSVDDQGASSSWNVGLISIAPNPSSGAVTISTSTAASNATLELVASDGRIVERFTIESGQAMIMPGTLATGVYRAVLRTAGGVTSTPFVITP